MKGAFVALFMCLSAVHGVPPPNGEPVGPLPNMEPRVTEPGVEDHGPKNWTRILKHEHDNDDDGRNTTDNAIDDDEDRNFTTSIPLTTGATVMQMNETFHNVDTPPNRKPDANETRQGGAGGTNLDTGKSTQRNGAEKKVYLNLVSLTSAFVAVILYGTF